MKAIQLFGACASVIAMTAGSASAQDYLYEPTVGFPDFGFMEAPGTYVGPVFVLSDDFPKDMPDLDPEVAEILAMDFESDPLGYVMAVRDYVFKGNIHGGPVANDFVLQNNSEGNDWYHVPWQHWGPSGREGYHGLTREGPLEPQVLHQQQTQSSSAYAVGFYNGPGGFTIGQVWPSADEGPDLTHMIEAMETGQGFPEGTVVGKFLFTVLGEDQVPYLTNPLRWQAYMYNCDVIGLETCPSDLSGKPRATQMVNLLQMDVMVKDLDAKESGGWVFGTFAYNGDAPQADEYGSVYGAACEGIDGPGKNWCNLIPVGVMWGNDPDNAETFINSKPTETVINANLTQTWINPDPALPPMHLGFNSRLNGPADNPTSSCMSCHSTGQVASISPIMPWLPPANVAIPKNGETASRAWMRWFRNFQDGEAFDAGQAISMDFSMQLTKSVENYLQYRGQIQGGGYALNYWSDHDSTPISRGATTPSN
ncbi:MAG: hypothetical protein QNJ09_17000 [Paracoccaceae bacterium]|nr:hypothetical protein [Paracoccaceae bacterium]